MKNKPFKESEIKYLIQQVTTDEISFSRMVEMINNKAKAFALETCKETLINASNSCEHIYNQGYSFDYLDKYGIRTAGNIPKEIMQ